MNEQPYEKLSEEVFPEVAVVKHNRFSLVWIIPIIAAGIGIWLFLTAVIARGVPITITFKDGANVDSKTMIHYDGVSVGNVNSIKLNKTLDGVIIEANLQRSAAGLASKGSQFWIVRPKLGIGGVSGLETIISGSYIEAQPGKGPRAKYFEGLEEPPPPDSDIAGLKIIIKSDKLGSLNPGAPVYYRELKVGEVEICELAGNAQYIDIKVNIFSKYAPLVHDNSQFWNASGIGMTVGLFGAKIKSESMQAILTGGMAFATPNNQQMGPQSKDGAVFELSDNPKDEWLKWQPNIDLNGNGEQDPASQPQTVERTEKKNYVF